MPARMTDVLKHCEFIIWAGSVVRAANEHWTSREPFLGDVLMTRDGLSDWLLRWSVEEGLIEDPGPIRNRPASAYVAEVFGQERERVVEEARNYWRHLTHSQANNGTRQP